MPGAGAAHAGRHAGSTRCTCPPKLDVGVNSSRHVEVDRKKEQIRNKLPGGEEFSELREKCAVLKYCPPENLNEQVSPEIRKLANQVYKALKRAGLADVLGIEDPEGPHKLTKKEVLNFLYKIDAARLAKILELAHSARGKDGKLDPIAQAAIIALLKETGISESSLSSASRAKTAPEFKAALYSATSSYRAKLALNIEATAPDAVYANSSSRAKPVLVPCILIPSSQKPAYQQATNYAAPLDMNWLYSLKDLDPSLLKDPNKTTQVVQAALELLSEAIRKAQKEKNEEEYKSPEQKEKQECIDIAYLVSDLESRFPGIHKVKSLVQHQFAQLDLKHISRAELEHVLIYLYENLIRNAGASLAAKDKQGNQHRV